jgi:hypothetical protein
MGWMAWQQFHCDDGIVNEKTFTDMIDRLAADGWLEAGYEIISVDDCWFGPGRDANGDVYADPKRFPHGMKWLADYAHAQHVKLGIYYDLGVVTCDNYTGSLGFLRQDARTLVRWGIDSIKVDGCMSTDNDRNDGFIAFAFFLNETGVPILYNNEWPLYTPKLNRSLLPISGNSWRIGADVRCTWESIMSVAHNYADNNWSELGGPGAWNDLDQITVGCNNKWDKGLNQEESRTNMAIWVTAAAPLMMTNDLRHIEQWQKDILTNPEVIAIHQDVMGKPGKRLTPATEDAQVWARPLHNGDWSVALINKADAAQDIKFPFKLISELKNEWKLRDLWAKKDLGTFKTEFIAKNVAAHDTVFLRCQVA